MMRVRLGSIGLLAVLAVAVVAVAVAATTAASNKRAARRDAPRLLRALVLPPGATPASSDPSPHDQLAQPGLSFATPALVDIHRFWRVAGDPTNVEGWFRKHVPAGSSVFSYGGSSGPGYEILTVAFDFPARTGVLGSRDIVVEVTRARGGGTAIRADAEDVWLVPRPKSERVPASVNLITYTVSRLNLHTGTTTTSAPTTVTKQSDVRKIVSLVNGLPRAQPGAEACPADIGPDVDLKFYYQQGGPVVAEADAGGSGCGGVSFTLGGRHEPELAGGAELVHQLEKLLGFKG
jgi:hypothetical protein